MTENNSQHPLPTALDFYSGIGGWSLGLRFSGIYVSESYEKWASANETNFVNNGHHANCINIRDLDVEKLPKNIDFVVGSPPCTEFSYSNRGGSGDIAEGLLDIKKFLTIISILSPRYWAMENVPRVAKILRGELKQGGQLAEFENLVPRIEVIDMAQFGLPQRRRRCIAGNFDLCRLLSYQSTLPKRTLGDVVRLLNAEETVADPIYGDVISKSNLTEHDPSDYLDLEEMRINKAAKLHHPIYNSMPFPDRLERPVRTITATCTRVSRESVVISPDDHNKSIRRLSMRERASLQGFPINYQFYASSYSQKMQMIGNALPPLFAFYMGHTFLGTDASEVESVASLHFPRPQPRAQTTKCDARRGQFRRDRRFRFAVPNLQLKSGVRFELANAFDRNSVLWSLKFYYGNSKDIRIFVPNITDNNLIFSFLPMANRNSCNDIMREFRKFLEEIEQDSLQRVWCRRGPSAIHPFQLLDQIDVRAKALRDELVLVKGILADELLNILEPHVFSEQSESAIPGRRKLLDNCDLVSAGIILGSAINSKFSEASVHRRAGNA